jgi:hypothetical protein
MGFVRAVLGQIKGVGVALFGAIPQPVVIALIALNAVLWAALALSKFWLPLILPNRPEREWIVIALVVAGVVLFFFIVSRWALRGTK